MSTAAITVLLFCLLAACVRNYQLRRRIEALKIEAARSLEDDGLLAQLETADALGSEFAHGLLEAGRSIHLALPPMRAPRYPVLGGEMHQLWQADYGACSSTQERRKVNNRWHNKGYQFPSEIRMWLLQKCLDEDGRNFYRKMFDEQDKRAITGTATASQ